MHKRVLILTVTERNNLFPENFSCWCAGTLEAKGHHTKLETIRVENFLETIPGKISHIHKEKRLKALASLLPTTEKLVLILPEYNNMLPFVLDSFIGVLSSKKEYTSCKLVSIVFETNINSRSDLQYSKLFNYPSANLDTLFGLPVYTNRIQIKNNPSGSMCKLFAESYSELHLLIQGILNSE